VINLCHHHALHLVLGHERESFSPGPLTRGFSLVLDHPLANSVPPRFLGLIQVGQDTVRFDLGELRQDAGLDNAAQNVGCPCRDGMNRPTP